MRLRIGSGFSGIGGLELGLARALDAEVVWQIEKDLFRLSVLSRNFPHAKRYRDILDVRPADLAAVDLFCLGFPCKDVSSAGKRRGILEGPQSRLWFAGLALVEAKSFPLVVVENVTSGKKLWLPQVRRDLHLLGYDTDALAVSAFDCGAPHKRERVLVVAWRRALADADGGQELLQPGGRRGPRRSQEVRSRRDRELRPPADADREQLRQGEEQEDGARGRTSLSAVASQDGASRPPAHAHREGELQPRRKERAFWRWSLDRRSGRWSPLPAVRGVAPGVSRRLARLAALGDAVVPAQSYACGLYVKHEVLPRLVAGSLGKVRTWP